MRRLSKGNHAIDLALVVEAMVERVVERLVQVEAGLGDVEQGARDDRHPHPMKLGRLTVVEGARVHLDPLAAVRGRVRDVDGEQRSLGEERFAGASRSRG
jgi:hypothetical protein